MFPCFAQRQLRFSSCVKLGIVLSLSVSSQQRFCCGSYKWAYGGNSLLGIKTGSIRTSHIGRLDEGCFLADKYHVKCSISMKMCVVFYAKLRGFLTLCPDWKCALKYVVGLRCMYASAYFWVSFWLISRFSASICLCTKCKFQRKISDIHQLIMQAKFRTSGNLVTLIVKCCEIEMIKGLCNFQNKWSLFHKGN